MKAYSSFEIDMSSKKRKKKSWTHTGKSSDFIRSQVYNIWCLSTITTAYSSGGRFLPFSTTISSSTTALSFFDLRSDILNYYSISFQCSNSYHFCLFCFS
jgi:hypothetical protein